MSDSAEPDVALPTAPSPDAPKKTYNASCHCGAFRYSVAVSPPLDDSNAVVMECNCSICVCNGYLFVYVPDELVIFTEGSIEQFKVSLIRSKQALKGQSTLTSIHSLTLLASKG